MFFASVHVDPMVSKFVILSTIIILVGFVLRIFKQPSMITYIVVGVLVGPLGMGLIKDEELITNLGSLGLVLLLFFIGMKIHLPDLIANWRVSVIGTLIQVLMSVLTVWVLGKYFDWKLNQIIMLGFVTSISSTAVIVKLLQEREELYTKVGQIVLGILLVQDVLIVPMLIVLGYLGGREPEGAEVLKQIIGGVLIVGIMVYVFKNKEIRLPFKKLIERDHEMQVFIAFSLCFGFSMITAYLELSAALGAFVAGIVLASTKSTQWIHDSLSVFKIMFVALFFVSVGMLIDLNFLKNNALTIGLLVMLVFFINNAINVIVMRIFNIEWKVSIYAAALLSQVGEFSFVLGTLGYQAGIIEDYAYQLVISSIALTLLLSPFWISLTRKIIKYSPQKD